MQKYIISFGVNVFSIETPVVKKGEKIDWASMFKHVKAIVGTDATVELA